MLHSLCFHPTLSSTSYLLKSNTLPQTSNPPLYLKFRTSHKENIHYLKTLGLISPNTKPNELPSPDIVDQILTNINFLKSKGFQDAELPRIVFLCPQFFSVVTDPSEIAPVFDFLTQDLSASVKESCGLISKCPRILFSDVEYRLKPTLHYLRHLGVEKLNVPTSLNAHLLNTRVPKLEEKVKFLMSLGLTYQESAKICARLPAIFGYSIDNNLRPKFRYLVEEMEMSLEELKMFPQYFAFSLEKRIVPRRRHLKKRNVKIPLNRMLLWSDKRFYAKWK